MKSHSLGHRLGAGLFAAHFSAIAQSTGLPISYDVPSRSRPNIRSSGGGSLTQTPIPGVDGVTAAYSPFVAVDNTISLNGAVGSVVFAGTSPLTDFASSRTGWLFTQPDLASFGQYRMCDWIVINRALTITERINVEQWMKAKREASFS